MIPSGVEVYVASTPVDFRKGPVSLMALVRDGGVDPFNGALYVFRRGVGRLWSGAILETPGARCIPVAADRRRYDAANVGATRCISRRHGLVASARTRCDTTDRNVVRVATY